jgi:hypothetical protein
MEDKNFVKLTSPYCAFIVQWHYYKQHSPVLLNSFFGHISLMFSNRSKLFALNLLIDQGSMDTNTLQMKIMTTV